MDEFTHTPHVQEEYARIHPEECTGFVADRILGIIDKTRNCMLEI